MTTQQSDAVAARRELHRQDSGEFGTQQRLEDQSIVLPAAPSAPTREEVIDMLCRSSGEGMRPALEADFDKAQTPEGEALMCAYYASPRLHHQHVGRISPESFDTLAELGYTDVGQLTVDGYKVFMRGMDAVARERIEPERLAVLADIGGHTMQNASSWEKEAYLNADIRDLHRLVSIPQHPGIERYRAIAEMLGPDKADRLQRCIAAGLTTKELVEADDFEPELLAGIRELLPETRKSMTIRIAENGHSPKTVAAYGRQLAEDMPADELLASPLKPSILKAMYSGSKYRDVKVLEDLHHAGFTKASEIRAMAGVLGTDHPKELARARRQVEPEHAARFLAGFGSRKTKLDFDDIVAVRKLVRKKITDPQQLADLTSKMHKTVQWKADPSESALGLYAGLVQAGLDKDTIGVMSRAGIPVDKMPEMKDAGDYWAAGAPFREEYEKEQQWKAERKWIRVPMAWEYSEEDYRSV